MSTVSKRALMARINRKLARDGQRLHETRANSRWLNDLGYFYIVDDRNYLVATWLDLKELGREERVLRDGESVALD